MVFMASKMKSFDEMLTFAGDLGEGYGGFDEELPIDKFVGCYDRLLAFWKEMASVPWLDDCPCSLVS